MLCFLEILHYGKIILSLIHTSFPSVSAVKNLPATYGTQPIRIISLGPENPVEKKMATHFNILSRKTPWIGETAGLQSMGSQRVSHDWLSMQATYIHNYLFFLVLLLVIIF